MELPPTLRRLARSYTATDAVAQDAVQETWLVVIDKLDSFQGRSSLRTWVCVLFHTARRSGVRQARDVPFSSAWRDDHTPAVDASRFHGRRDAETTGTGCAPPVRWDEIPEDRLAAKVLRMVIDTAILALPPRQRQVITAMCRAAECRSGWHAGAVIGESPPAGPACRRDPVGFVLDGVTGPPWARKTL